MEEFPFQKCPLYKLIILGESNVGKTAFKLRFIEDSYQLDYKATIGVDYKIKCLKINEDHIVKLTIWDTAGQERYRSITGTYIKDADGIIFCYDICDKKSFQEISNYWIDFAKNCLGSNDDCSMILVGTKLDKQHLRKVSTVEAKTLADKLNIKFMETSSMKNINIEEVFFSISSDIFIKKKSNNPKPKSSSIRPFECSKCSKIQKKKCCV